MAKLDEDRLIDEHLCENRLIFEKGLNTCQPKNENEEISSFKTECI